MVQWQCFISGRQFLFLKVNEVVGILSYGNSFQQCKNAACVHHWFIENKHDVVQQFLFYMFCCKRNISSLPNLQYGEMDLPKSNTFKTSERKFTKHQLDKFNFWLNHSSAIKNSKTFGSKFSNEIHNSNSECLLLLDYLL